ncbi:MAG: NUDIX domain-containing protein [Candidatus Berkelbacteria bacterium]
MSEIIPRCNNTSVGMIVRYGDKILLIERKKFPFGFAPPAGHVDDGEDYAAAAGRELSEEVGVTPVNLKLLIEGDKNNPCRRPNGSWHHWKIYETLVVDDKIDRSFSETKKAGWYSIEEIKFLAEKTDKYLQKEISEENWEKSLGIEPVWCEWFRELEII